MGGVRRRSARRVDNDERGPMGMAMNLNQRSPIKTNSPRSSRRLLALHILLAFILVAGCLQIYIFHSRTAPVASFDGRQSNEHLVTERIHRDSTFQTDVSSNFIKANGKQTDVIVYLAQFSEFHSSYGFQKDSSKGSITGVTKLSKSLDLLYQHYVEDFPLCDVIIFYTDGPPGNETISKLTRNRPQLQFRELKGKWWTLPHGLRAIERFKWNRPAFR